MDRLTQVVKDIRLLIAHGCSDQTLKARIEDYEEEKADETHIPRLSIPGNYCAHCHHIIGPSVVCEGCGWVDPLTFSRKN